MHGALIAFVAMLVGLLPAAERIGAVVDISLDRLGEMARFNNGCLLNCTEF
jgi:hypothetical protein